MNFSAIRSFGFFLALLVMGVSGQVMANDSAPKANEVVPVIDGEVFDRIVIVKNEDGKTTQAIKYIRSTEKLESWTKQVVYARIIEEEISTAGAYAGALIRALQQVNVGAKYQASASEDGKVVLLDFIVQPRGQNFMEFNLYRIEEGAKGVYSLQMIGRMPVVQNPTPENMAPVIQMRKAWLAQAAQFDMVKVKALLDAE